MGKYAKYDATIVSLTIIGFVVPLVLTILFLVFSYQRSLKRAQRAQRDITEASAGFCEAYRNLGFGARVALLAAAPDIRNTLNNACGVE